MRREIDSDTEVHRYLYSRTSDLERGEAQQRAAHGDITEDDFRGPNEATVSIVPQNFAQRVQGVIGPETLQKYRDALSQPGFDTERYTVICRLKVQELLFRALSVVPHGEEQDAAKRGEVQRESFFSSALSPTEAHSRITR